MLAAPTFNRVLASQEAKYIDVTPDLLWSIAHTLRQQLEDGWLQRADLRAIELRSALHGKLPEEMYLNVNSLESLQEVDKPQPQLTTGLLPLADKVLQALEAKDLEAARTYTQQLATQVHAQYSSYLHSQPSYGSGDSFYDRYLQISEDLSEALRSGDVAKAAALAPEVEKAQDELDAKGRRFTLKRQNIYNINDALGRVAFLHKNYRAAGDYLLKAADTPPGDPVLSSFGPDVWLARALLQAGYKDVVVTFFERCKSFWPKPQLDEWIAVIRNGGTPDFKMNIFSKDPVPSR